MMEELRAASNPVILRPEMMGKSAMLGSLEDTLEMSKLDGVEPCIDFAHLHARPGDGSMNTYDEWSNVLETYGNALGDSTLKTLSIHLSGIEYGPKGEKESPPNRRIRSRSESHSQSAQSLQQRRAYAHRKPCDGGRCAPRQKALGGNQLNFLNLEEVHDKLHTCRLCLDAGHDIFPRAVFSGGICARMMTIGQAPRHHRKRSGPPIQCWERDSVVSVVGGGGN
ncbi:MAG: hypothetical protein HC806_06565 [Anaerolineae bacterium]|nr:hypothetical protein [Anaerolineae bacterium]